ncbi:MAG TPA: MDR family MFS transporter [Chloroflexota bacterium]|nr:MDR family MFS transporter [Chloroflexota bacterium]
MRAHPPASAVYLATLSARQRLATLAGCLLALLLAALDQTVVGTAMPRVIAELHGFEHYAWVTTAYLLSSTAVVPIVGKLSDLYGQRRFLIGSAVGFVLASMLCGLAQSMTQLIVFRGLQGIAGGTLMATVFTVISVLYPPAERGRIQGVFSGVFGLASVLGPLLGGYLTDHLSWRWVFYVNLPVGIGVVTLLLVAFPAHRAAGGRRSIDYAGAVALVLAVTPLLLALSWGGREYAWSSPVILGLLAAAGAMTALFVAIERRAAEPIIPLSLFREPLVAWAMVALLLMVMGMFGAIMFVPLFAQAVLGQSATGSGTLLMPMTLAMVVTSIIGGQVVSRTGRYRLVALVGIGCATVGLFLLSRLGPQASYAEIARDVLLLGIGLGPVMPLFTLIAQNAVDLRRIGVATALSQFTRSIGSTLGVAVFGWLLTTRFDAALQQTLPPAQRTLLAADQLARLSNPLALLQPEGGAGMPLTTSPDVPAFAAEAVRLALAQALHEVFLAGSVLMLLALVAVCFLREIPLRRSNLPPSTGEPAVELAVPRERPVVRVGAAD